VIVRIKLLLWAEAMLIFSICLLTFVAVLGFLWHVEKATPWSAMNASEWGVWVGSIGTIGALIGTISLATESERRRRREQLNLTMISAARFALWIPLVQSGLSTAKDYLANLASGADPRPTFKRALSAIEGSGVWASSDLVPLVHLPNHAATHISLVTPKIEWVINGLKAASTSETLRISDTHIAIEILQRNIQDVIDALDEPLGVCITFLELHGFTGEQGAHNSDSENSRR
jgi:hypothetical protein